MSEYRNQVFYRSCEAMLEIPDGVVQTCVTSPPYWGLRDYGVDGQIGLEPTLDAYVERLVRVFREVKRTLRDDGTLWLNLGDTHFGDSPVRKASIEAWSPTWDKSQTRSRGGKRRSAARQGDLKPKDLCGVPWAVAFALRADGWFLRSDIIWHKPSAMPVAAMDRPTPSHEYIFLLTKKRRYFYDAPATFDNLMGNKHDVWDISPIPYSGAHFATFPPGIPVLCIRAGSKPGDLVLDPFAGSGTTLEVAESLGRAWVGYELQAEYRPLIEARLRQQGLFTAGNA